MSDSFILILFGIFLLICLVLIGYLFVSLAPLGDERRKMMVQKSAATSFMIMVGVYLLNLIELFIKVYQAPNEPIKNSSPFTWLVISSLVFTLNLYYNKKKYR